MKSYKPPFDQETATKKVRAAEDAWNHRNPKKVALAYTPDCTWRNRAEFINGRLEIEEFLNRKWSKELDYRLIKEPNPLHPLLRPPHEPDARNQSS